MGSIIKYSLATFLVLLGVCLLSFAAYDVFHPATRDWSVIAVTVVTGAATFLGGTAIIEISNAKVKRAGIADAEALFPELVAKHGCVTARMLYELTSLSTVNATRYLENLVNQGKAERVPFEGQWGYRYKSEP